MCAHGGIVGAPALVCARQRPPQFPLRPYTARQPAAVRKPTTSAKAGAGRVGEGAELLGRLAETVDPERRISERLGARRVPARKGREEDLPAVNSEGALRHPVGTRVGFESAHAVGTERRLEEALEARVPDPASSIGAVKFERNAMRTPMSRSATRAGRTSGHALSSR